MSDAQPGKVVLVTGAAKRVGREIALDFAGHGARVVVHYHTSADAAATTAADCRAAGGAAITHDADLTDAAAVDGLIAATLAAYGRLDVVVASASVFARTPWATVTPAEWEAQMRGNLTSTFLLARAAAPVMADGGVIITIGDWSGLRPYKDFLPYCVSKAGVIALSQALAQELAPRLRVNCVCPGTILPPPSAAPAALAQIAAQTPLGRIGDPADVVAAVRFLVEGTQFATGSVLVVDGGRLIANGSAYSHLG